MSAPAIKVRITTDSFDETIAFYTSLFGLQVVERWDAPGDTGVILSAASGGLLEIAAGEAQSYPDGFSLQFKVENAESLAAKAHKGALVEGPAPRPWGAIYVVLKDPNGIKVIGYEETARTIR